mmetsp:Transcript_3897/g.8903  ORF Transcript_3897/g.8903 Transcript_3897/m.8903 type:complete len:205 (+) Transcript_3897:211-825(+)
MNPAVSRTALRWSSGASAAGRRAIRPRTATASLSPLSSSPVVAAAPPDRRSFSDAARAQTDAAEDVGVGLSSAKLQGLYDTVVALPEEEVNALGAMVLQLLGRTIFPGQFGTPGGAGGTVAEGGAEPAEAVEEKTAFDVKLLGFDAKSKIKVIKEVRSIAGLGLKEAKELVEGAPKVVQKDLKQDKAEELKEKLEAVGAQVEIV